MKTKKKRFSPKTEVFFRRKSGEDQKKGIVFFLSSSSAQISMGGRSISMGDAQSRWGTRPPRSPYNLSAAPGLCQCVQLLVRNSNIITKKNTVNKNNRQITKTNEDDRNYFYKGSNKAIVRNTEDQ